MKKTHGFKKLFSYGISDEKKYLKMALKTINLGKLCQIVQHLLIDLRFEFDSFALKLCKYCRILFSVHIICVLAKKKVNRILRKTAIKFS